MFVIAACAVLVAIGVAIVVAWGGPAGEPAEERPGLARHVAASAGAGLVAGVLAAGAGGVAFGLILLIVVATRIEPLRSDNVDFAILGPAWLAVLAFAAVAVFHGMVVASVAERRGGRRVLCPGRALTAARVVLVVVLVVALPGAVGAIADILERG
jgi:hypothetical protein